MVRTAGMEEESLLVRADGSLAHAGDQVVAEASRRDDAAGQFEQEFKRPQAEIGSAPAQTPSESGEDVARLRREPADAAATAGAPLLASADPTHR